MVMQHEIEDQHPMLDHNVAPGTSVLDAALDADALFTVHKAGIALPDGRVPLVTSGEYEGRPEANQTYRYMPDGSQHRLCKSVSWQYPTSNYQQLVEMADGLFPGTCTGLRIFEGGRRLMFTQALGAKVDLGGGDTLQANLLWMGSLNQTWGSQVSGTAGRAFCTNQLSMADTYINVRRTTNHDLILLERGTVLAMAMEQFEEFVTKATWLKAAAVDSAACWRVLKAIFPAPKPKKGETTVSARVQGNYDRKIAGVRYFWAEENDGPSAGTAWALYNAIQSYEYHTLTKGQADRQAEVMTGHQPLAEKGYDAILEAVGV